MHAGKKNMDKSGDSVAAVDMRFALHAGNPLMLELRQMVMNQCGGQSVSAVAENKPAPRVKPAAARPVGGDIASHPRLLVAERDIQRVVKNIEHLFTLPDHVLRIMNMLRSHDVEVETIVKEINRDPVLAAETLKVVNSGFYGFQHKVSSIQHAIVIMGLHVIQSIVLSVSVVDFLSLKNLWRHSLVCAHACTLLARQADLPKCEDISVAGLLHDIGKAVSAEYLGGAYNAALEMARRKKMVFYEAERLHCGVTHAEIGQWLLARWNLAPETVAAIGFHHNFMPDGRWAERVAVVHVADVLTNAAGFNSGEELSVPALRPDALSVLNLDMEQLHGTVAGIMEFAQKQEKSGD